MALRLRAPLGGPGPACLLLALAVAGSSTRVHAAPLPPSGIAQAASTAKAGSSAKKADPPKKTQSAKKTEPAKKTSSSTKASSSKKSEPAKKSSTASSSKKGAAPATPQPPALQDGDGPTAHRKGPPPKTPSATLPSDVPLPAPNARARAIVAEGPTAEQLARGAEDELLSELRDLESVLFPKAVRGLQSGWSWDLPEADPNEVRADQLGLPLVPQALTARETLSAKDSEWLRSLTLPDLPVRLDRRVVTYLQFYRDNDRGRAIAAIWARKSGRYVPAMKAELRRAGLPTDLVWLSLIESGHNPTIVSPAGAMGLWQFMPHSGRMYGLVVDRWVDERRDPARSTQAAVRFLSDLHRRFGNWELAMGAYNMGYAGMSNAIRKFNTNDYWTLSRLEGGIPWETTLYVPKIFAIAIVMNNREAFGLQNIQPDPPIGFDTILVEPATPLEDVARAAGVPMSSVRELNLHYIADRTPPVEGAEGKRWPVRVPLGTGEQAVAKLAKSRPTKSATYRVRFGDRLADVAAELGTSEATLRSLNALSADETLEPGTVLLVPDSGGKKAASKEPEVVVVAAPVTPGPETRRVFFRVSSGQELVDIALAFGVSVRDLASWNALNEEARLSDGMVLQVLVPKNRDLSDVRHIRDSEARLLIAGSKEFHEHFEGLKGKRRVEVVVKDGDTLASVGARFGMSVGSMERVNRKSRNTKLVAGETLIVYTDKPVTGVDSALEPAPLPEVVATLPEALPAVPVTAGR